MLQQAVAVSAAAATISAASPHSHVIHPILHIQSEWSLCIKTEQVSARVYDR